MDYRRENQQMDPLGDLGSILVDVPTLEVARISLVGPDGSRQPFPAGWDLQDTEGEPCRQVDGCFFVDWIESYNVSKNGKVVMRLVHVMQQHLLIPAN